MHATTAPSLWRRNVSICFALIALVLSVISFQPMMAQAATDPNPTATVTFADSCVPSGGTTTAFVNVKTTEPVTAATATLSGRTQTFSGAGGFTSHTFTFTGVSAGQYSVSGTVTADGQTYPYNGYNAIGTCAGTEPEPPPTTPEDSDLDGVPDSTDACDTEPGPASNNGCPVKEEPPPPPPADVDSDKDGVNDIKDKCSDTPRGTKVDANGCPIKDDTTPPPPGNPGGGDKDKPAPPVDKDPDKDGVNIPKDKCPDTPTGTKVDANGCPLKDDTTPPPPGNPGGGNGDGGEKPEDAVKNQPNYWEGIFPDSTCIKFDGINDQTFTVPASPAGTVYVAAIVKAGSGQSVTEPHSVDKSVKVGDVLSHPSGKAISHVILCYKKVTSPPQTKPDSKFKCPAGTTGSDKNNNGKVDAGECTTPPPAQPDPVVKPPSGDLRADCVVVDGRNTGEMLVTGKLVNPDDTIFVGFEYVETIGSTTKVYPFSVLPGDVAVVEGLYGPGDGGLVSLLVRIVLQDGGGNQSFDTVTFSTTSCVTEAQNSQPVEVADKAVTRPATNVVIAAPVVKSRKTVVPQAVSPQAAAAAQQSASQPAKNNVVPKGKTDMGDNLTTLSGGTSVQLVNTTFLAAAFVMFVLAFVSYPRRREIGVRA